MLVLFLLFSVLSCGKAKFNNTFKGGGPNISEVLKGHFEGVKGISEEELQNLDVNSKYGEFEDTLFHIAAAHGKTDVIEMLLEAGADINAKNDQGHTPLHSAVLCGQKEFVRCLLEAGADVTIKDNRERLPINYAESLKYSEIRDNIKKWIEEIEKLSKKAKDNEVNVNEKYGEYKEALLHRVISINRIDLLRDLLKAGVDVNAKNILGHTPLHRAVLSNKKEFARCLLEAGSNVTIEDNRRQTPIYYATSNNFFDIFDILTVYHRKLRQEKQI